MYKVFSVDDCFDEYAMSYRYIGATDKDDLIAHLPDIYKSLGHTKGFVKKIVKDKDWRIKEIDHLFTDLPYEILDTFGYIE